MELSTEVQTLLEKYRRQSPKKEEDVEVDSNKGRRSSALCASFLDDLIDVDAMDLGDEETWLYKPNKITMELNDEKRTPMQRLSFALTESTTSASSSSSPKSHFDSRTFTRPKKQRASAFTKSALNNSSSDTASSSYHSETSRTLTEEIDNYISNYDDPVEEEAIVPKINFDLSQPASGMFFDSILANATGDIDSFTNMSPPSFVDSMCSSTFTNLMDSSIIKNDPVLRQIRDEEVQIGNIIFNEEAPLYQSLTESCSSVTTDMAESFLRRTLPTINGSFSDTFRIAEGEFENSKEKLNQSHTENIDPNVTFTENAPTNPNNDTYSADSDLSTTPIQNGTFRKSDRNVLLDRRSKDTLNNTFKLGANNRTFDNNRQNLNGTYRRNNSSHGVLNETFAKMKLDETTNKCDQEKVDYDIKDLDNAIDDYLSEKMVAVCGSEERLSPRTADSYESLDRMSSLSSGSRGSRNLLMSEVEAIVQEQERSLQVMSTPKPAKSMTKLTHPCFSPITSSPKDCLSDSEISADDYNRQSTRKTAPMNNLLPGSNLERNAAKSMNYLQNQGLAKPKSINTLSSNLQSIRPTIKASLGNLPRASSGPMQQGLAGTQFRGSYSNLKPPSNSGSSSALTYLTKKAAERKIGSAVNLTITKNTEVFKQPAQPANNTFVKPTSKIPSTSGMPRPATSIPRPMMSRIPAPKSGLRPPAVRTKASLLRPSSATERY